MIPSLRKNSPRLPTKSKAQKKRSIPELYLIPYIFWQTVKVTSFPDRFFLPLSTSINRHKVTDNLTDDSWIFIVRGKFVRILLVDRD